MTPYGRPPRTHCAGCSRRATGAHPPKARARQEERREIEAALRAGIRREIPDLALEEIDGW